jgi:hypothetical protein
MVEIRGLTREKIMETYYASTSEVRKWMRENIRLLREENEKTSD